MKEKLKKIGIITGIFLGLLLIAGMIFYGIFTPEITAYDITLFDPFKGYEYTITEDAVYIEDTYGSFKVPEDGRVVIPDKLWGKPVVRIGLLGLPGAVTSLHIPDSVITLRGIYGANGLEEITGGKNIEKITWYGVSNCESITYVEFAENNHLKRVANFIEDCPSITSLTLSGSIEEVGTTVICNCENLESITFGENVKVIEELAVTDCPSLTSVTFLNEDVVIEEGAFTRCPWAESPEGKAFIEAHKKTTVNK
ncbi:MAG: leucine-rich repeat protein [Lachnospiraceae bacterium]|nr:leucine-rich repeat protein [Lachnospiraceae bacterium]